MSDTDLILGELKEFKRAALAEFVTLNKRVDELKLEQNQEANFRWKLRGEMAAIAAMIHPIAPAVKTLAAKFGFGG